MECNTKSRNSTKNNRVTTNNSDDSGSTQQRSKQQQQSCESNMTRRLATEQQVQKTGAETVSGSNKASNMNERNRVQQQRGMTSNNKHKQGQSNLTSALTTVETTATKATGTLTGPHQETTPKNNCTKTHMHTEQGQAETMHTAHLVVSCTKVGNMHTTKNKCNAAQQSRLRHKHWNTAVNKRQIPVLSKCRRQRKQMPQRTTTRMKTYTK